MCSLRIIILLLIASGACQAQADFRFYVFDETSSDTLHYEFVQDITVYDWDSDDDPRLIYYTEYRVYGINQMEFTFETESFEGAIPRKEYEGIKRRARELPNLDAAKTERLDAKGERTLGWVTLKGKSHTVSSRPESAGRKKWQALLDGLLAKHAPLEKRKTTRTRTAGDLIPAQAVLLEELLKAPEKYDGKRVSVSGFYGKFPENSSLTSSREAFLNFDEKAKGIVDAVWIGQVSSFAKAEDVAEGSGDVTVEGTYRHGNGGHFGLWPGEINRVTSVRRVKPAVPAEQGGARQPATAVDSKSEGKEKPKPESEGRSQ